MPIYRDYLGAQRIADRLSFAAVVAGQAGPQLTGDEAASAARLAATANEAAAGASGEAQTLWDAFDRARRSTQRTGWGLLAVVTVAIVWLALAANRFIPPWLFAAELSLFLLALVATGLAVNGRVFGAAIDARNRVSLSKLQMLMWTALAAASLLVMTAYWLSDTGTVTPLLPGPAALAAGKLKALPADLVIFPPELLLVLGVSAASFVATPMLLNLKAAETPSDAALQSVADARGTEPANVGNVDARSDPAEASLADIFHGDEVGPSLSIDVSKVQQIAIGLLVWGLYGASVFKALAAAHGQLLGLPAMNEDFVKLLAISHASYLGYKAVPKATSAPGPFAASR